jgi:hypothetical protein
MIALLFAAVFGLKVGIVATANNLAAAWRRQVCPSIDLTIIHDPLHDRRVNLNLQPLRMIGCARSSCLGHLLEQWSNRGSGQPA